MNMPQKSQTLFGVFLCTKIKNIIFCLFSIVVIYNIKHKINLHHGKIYFFNFQCNIFLDSCQPGLYKIQNDIHGEPILNEKSQYSFTEKPSNKDLIKIDTTAFYIQITDNDLELKNPRVIIFHSDGYFKKSTLKYFGKFDVQRKKNSVYYGGRYKINGNDIFIESFLPTSPITRKYIKKIIQGKISEDYNEITFDFGEYIQIFKRMDRIPQN